MESSLVKLYSARSSFPHIQAPSWLINESLKWGKKPKSQLTLPGDWDYIQV